MGVTLKTIVLLLQLLGLTYKENSNFGYEIGSIYKYKYTGNVRSLTSTTSTNVVDESGVNIHSIVTFQALSNCDYVMEVLEVGISDYYIKNSIKTPANNAKFHQLERQLKERPLHFAFNGKIDTICPGKDEIQEIIDIKRGILSVFQNSNPNFKPDVLVYETDITGNCETHYKITELNGIKHINKTKNLDACDHRMQHYLSWQTVPYVTNANARSLPLLKSTLNCALDYSSVSSTTGDVLQNAACHEKHVFQPFSNGDNGALTILTQEMKLLEANKSDKKYKAPDDVKRGTLIYEYKEGNSETTEGLTKARKVLIELESKTEDGVEVDVPGLFSKLVFTFQHLSKNSLLELFYDINEKQRKFYFDAISLITTTSGIEVMADLYENKKINEKQMNSWLVSLNFARNPSKKTLQVIFPLIFHTKIQQNAHLALSSVLYKYCSKRANCLEDVVISEIIKTIEKTIMNNCMPNTSYGKNDIFLALKSIGNAGLTTSFYYLQSCYMNNELPVELRLASIAAHRRMKCPDNENLDDFKNLFANTRVNSEIRIASYLASMQCASHSLFAQVKDVLFKEEANQMGSFIWTHLTNLQETSVPWKQGIRKLLENEFLKNKFHTDIRKYSRNYEASTFFDSIAAGGGIEANVIFSSESYLPRSAMLNFTLDLFGETINLLELGTRMEGFEDIVENLFAPMGHFPDTNVHSYLEHSKDVHNKQQRIDSFGEHFQALPKEPSGSIYAKIFGNEIAYAQFNDLEDLFGVPNSGKEALDMLMKFIKENNVDYTKSFSFLDATYKIPTVIGFPLQLKANGTATVGLTAGGEVNIKDLWNYKMLIKGKIYPSASVQVTSTMSVDSYAGETGVQYVGTLNSNMYIDGYANMELGKIVDVKVNVPKKQMDILTVSSDVYVLHDEETFAIQDASENVDNSEYCTDEFVSKLIGLQFCNQWRIINASDSLHTPNFPLTGSFKYSMHIKKTDTFDFYQLYLETQVQTDVADPMINFIIDTPQSQIDRKLQFVFNIDTQKYSLMARVQSPFALFQLASKIERELNKYKFQLWTALNNKEIIVLHSTFDVKDEGDMITYEPLAHLNYKQQKIVAVTGKLSHIKGGDYTADLKLEGFTEDVAQIHGSLNSGSDAFTIKTNIMSKHFNGDFEATLSAQANDVLAQSVMSYTYKGSREENISVRARYNKAYGDISSNMLVVGFETSQWPTYDMRLQLANERGDLYFNNSAEFKFFETTWRGRQIIKLKRGFSDPSPDLLLLADLTCPEKQVDYRSELSFSASKNHLKSRALFQLNSIQRIETLLDYSSNTTSEMLRVFAYYPQESWSLNGQVAKDKARNYKFNIDGRHKVNAHEYILVTLHGDYKNSSVAALQDHKFNCFLDFPENGGELQTPWHISGFLEQSKGMLISYTKVSTTERDYTGNVNWIHDTLVLSIFANDKPLFMVNGRRLEDEISAMVALNIFQHYELNVKLVLPYQRFDLSFYWDKDRDETRKFLFNIERNSFKGEYNMNVEYPNQKISTDIVLMPTQVIMNVTWGVKISQRIYLKVGNKYYDVGGIWFGELETPFKYLEKQQFTLKYYVVSDSFDIQSDLSWRSQSINLLITGAKSEDSLSANLQLNTTLPEIRKVGAAISHTFQPINNNYQSDAAFDYNDHSIRAQSNWQMDGYRVDSQFRIESPTHTIDPIFGALKLNNDDDDSDSANNMQFILSWQRKNITASYHFKSDTSSIEIETPFEGIEKTIFKYSVVTNAETVYLATMVDIFRQNNSVALNWSNSNDSTTFCLDLTSPMTGRYMIYFTHSTVLGVLQENFKIQGPENKDLFQMKIEGDIEGIDNMNVTFSSILLEHKAVVSVINTREPYLSNVILIWNERTVNSKMQLDFNETQLQYFNWLIESNLFAPVNLSYEHNDKQCITSIVLPNDYTLSNHFYHFNVDNWRNELRMRTPTFSLNFDHKISNKSLSQQLITLLNHKKVYYVLNTTSENDLNVIYNFYENDQILHSYNITGFLQQTENYEQFSLAINSTSDKVNGRFEIVRNISEKLSDNSVEMTVDFPTYNLVLVANDAFFLWTDKLRDKLVKITYKNDLDTLEVNLISSYDEIPSGNMLLTFKNAVKFEVNVNEYHLHVQGDKATKIATLLLKNNQTDIVSINLDLNGLHSINVINYSGKYDALFSYEITQGSLLMKSVINWPENKLAFESLFIQEVGKIKGNLKFQFNNDVYSSAIFSNSENSIDFDLVTPSDEFTGKIHVPNFRKRNFSLVLELSSQTSKNFLTIRNLTYDNFHLTAVSNYLALPQQEIGFIWNVFNASGLGHYTNGQGKKYKFTLETKNFKSWAFAIYHPDSTVLSHLNYSADLSSKSNFEVTIEGSWYNQKIKLEVRNLFGEHYQTTFNLMLPIKGWTRTSLDCTLNDRKVGIALVAKNQHMSLVARRTGSDLLRMEYQGETLLEITSSEGITTLRTTSRFGAYRLFIQSTHTPGIYVFSILKNGENLISFMMQNSSANHVLHYKAKLIAPQLFPNNATLAVTFIANEVIWKFLDFKLKKDNKPVLELIWEASIIRESIDCTFLFQSQIEALPNFKIYPRIRAIKYNEVEAEVRYSCRKFTECNLRLVLTPKKIVCTSQSPYDLLNFHLQSNYIHDQDKFDADFEFNDFNRTNIAFNVTWKSFDHININGLVKLDEATSAGKIELSDKNLEMYVSQNPDKYLRAGIKLAEGAALVDISLPIFSASSNISLANGFITFDRNKTPYKIEWNTANKNAILEFTIKEKQQNIADFKFRNTFVENSTVLEIDTMLHASYKDNNLDIIVTGLLSDDIAKATFSLFSPFESIKRVNFGTLVKHSQEKLHLEQYLQLPNDEFVLNASASSNRRGHLLRLYCKPFNNPLMNKTINAKAKYSGQINNKPVYKFDVDLGDGFTYKVNAIPDQDSGYIINVTTTRNTQVAYLSFNMDSLDFKLNSLGGIEHIWIKLTHGRYVFASDMFNYRKVFFVQPGAYGLLINELQNDTIKTPLALIYKTRGELPAIDFELDNYNSQNDIFILGKFQNSGFKIDVDEVKHKGILQIQENEKELVAKFEETSSRYEFNLINGNVSENFILDKNFSRLTNEIYTPFELTVKNKTFELTSKNCTVKFGKNTLVDISSGNHNFFFALDLINLHNMKMRYRRENQQQLLFAMELPEKLEFALSDLLYLKYNLNHGLVTKFNYKTNGNVIKCDLYAKSVHNISFTINRDDELCVSLKGLFENSSVAYYFHVPKWDLFRLLDFAFTWNIKKPDTYFSGSLKIDSEHTGEVKAFTKFELKQHLLDIESYFNAPFLEGFEVFYGKVYIPKEFRPHIEFVLPNQTYKLFYNHSDKSIEFDIVCKNENLNFALVNNGTLKVNIQFPDERFKKLFIEIDRRDKLLNFELNDQYHAHINFDLTFVDIKTPLKGYEKFGYMFKHSLEATKREFKLVIVHPAYEVPLGLSYSLSLGNKHIDGLFSFHLPFQIADCDFAVMNLTTTLLPDYNKGDFNLNIASNNIDTGLKFRYILNDKTKFVSGQTHYNQLNYIGAFNVEQTKIYLILGDPHPKDNFLSTFPEYDRFISPKLFMFYISLQDENLNLLLHNKWQPFSLQRSKNTFIKVIWDLRKPKESTIGAKVEPNSVEIYFARDKLNATRRASYLESANYTVITLKYNELDFEYNAMHENRVRPTFNALTSERELRTPFGGLRMLKRKFVTVSGLIDRVEFGWGSLKPNAGSMSSKLIFNNAMTSQGTFTSTISSTLLPHDIVFNVDMSQFNRIPSVFEASFSYSNRSDKTINFQMYYNKTKTNDSVTTDRIFILKHPNSMIDYELYFNAVRMPDFSNGSIVFKYKDFDANVNEMIKASVRVDHDRLGVLAELNTNKNRLHFLARSTSGIKRHGFIAHIEINDKDPLNLECMYDFRKESPSVSAMAAYGNSRKYVFYAGLPNDKEITAKLGHEIYGKASLDALAIIKLNTTQLLWIKVLWKNNLYAPFHEAIFDEYNDLRFVIEATGKQIIDVIHDDTGKEFVQDFKDIKDRIVNYTVNELEMSMKAFRRSELRCTNSSNFICKFLLENEELLEFGEFLKEHLALMYDTIEIVFTSSLQSIRILFDAINVEIEEAMGDIKIIQHIKVDAKAILKRGINTARKSLKEMESIVVKLLDDFDKYVSNLKQQIEEFFDPFLSLVDDFIAYVEQRLAMLQIAILDTLDTIQHYIFNLREIKAMYSVYYMYVNWLEELHVIDMLEPVGDVIEDILETIIRDVKRVLDHYKTYLDALGDAIFGKYERIHQLPQIAEVREHVNRIYHKTIWVWNYHNMTQGLKSCVQKFSKDIDSMLSFVEIDDLTSNEDMEYSFGYNYVFRPENRLIEISQPLPVEWEAFNKSPSFEHYPLYKRIQGKSEQFIKFYKSRYDLIDMLENFVVDLYEPTMSPSTYNYAMIIGKSQYSTFNGLNYNFLSNCSYLLATDFKNKSLYSFSLIVNYKNTSGVIGKSYQIIANDNSFEIFSDKLITLNGRKMDLPIVYQQMTITKDNEIIVAESTRGFKMMCYFHYDFCTVQLSGWLFGKTAGLLGTLDNEQFTDTMSSLRSPSSNISEFIQSWQLQVKDECSFVEAPNNLQTNESEYVDHLCGLFFDHNDSPLRDCFDSVDPIPFAEMCTNEMRANPDFKVCAPAAAYVHRCRKARVAIEIPEMCVTCNDDIGYTEEIFDGHNNKTIDVVFITELDCLNVTIKPNLPKLLDDELNRKNFTSNRFASIGYGGNTLPKPHINTFDGEVWSTSEQVPIKFTLTGGNVQKKSKFTAIDAIKYAANLEQRIGVSKLFVLTQCEIATDVGNMPDIYNMLGEKDITLHILKPHPFGNQTQVAGINMDEYVPAMSSDRSDVNHNQIINKLEDVYSGLALSTNGTIFDLSKLDGNESDGDGSGPLWAQLVAKNVLASPCQKCKCVQDFNGVGKIECSRCLAPAVKQFLNEYEEGNKMKFNDNDDDGV